VEREAAALGELTQVRRQLGASCGQTRNQDRRARRRRKRIRQLVDTMQTWQQKNLPPSPVTQHLPAVWTEQAVKQLFGGHFPWQHTAGGPGKLPTLLVERFRDACAEVRYSVAARGAELWLNRLVDITCSDSLTYGGRCTTTNPTQQQTPTADNFCCVHCAMVFHAAAGRRRALWRSWRCSALSGSAPCSTSSISAAAQLLQPATCRHSTRQRTTQSCSRCRRMVAV